MTIMLDQFNEMAKNNTASADDWEGRMMFLAKLWSNSYADTLYNCYKWVGQMQSKWVEREKSFKDENDLFTSFLFNMLTQSYEIRRQSYRLIHFGKFPYNWPAYAESVGTLINLLIYFDSADGGALIIDENDFDSPYFYDLNGDL